MRIKRCLIRYLLNNMDLTCGQHSVYVCHCSNIPWLHHTNSIKVYEANRCTFRPLRSIFGKIPALKAEVCTVKIRVSLCGAYATGQDVRGLALLC